jgi:anaerobic selenocysteine-containing dehydrogenase
MKQIIYTSCTLDCPDGCGIKAHVENGRVVKLEGHSEHPFTRGYLCGKTYRFPERVYSAERELYPMRREGGQRGAPWVRIGWDEALDLAAERIRRFIAEDGSLSVMHYQRTGSWGATKHLSRRFWNLLGGPTTTSGSLCSGAARAGQAMDFGIRLGHDPSDIVNSKLVLLWGRNPMATNLHTVPLLKEVRAAQGKVLLIDPVRSQSATICDGHIQPRVARDAELAMAMAKVNHEAGLEDKAFLANHSAGFEDFRKMLDEHALGELCEACGVPQAQVRELAVQYATAKPASVLFGWGLNKYKHSAEIFRCVDALAAMCGHIGIPGGGATLGFQTARHFDKSVEAGDRVTGLRAIPEPMLGQGLLDASDPPVRMMFINGGNPINQSPNSNLVAKAFERLEFTVIVDMFLNDTADYADLFLPTTTFLEEEDLLVSWGHNILGGVNKVIEPVGEARSDLWIFQRLAERLGIGEEMAGTPREWLKRFLKPLEDKGVSVDQVMEGPVRCPTGPQVPFSDMKFPTKSGKYEFITEINLDSRVVDGYPLTFVTNFSKTWLLSQMTSAEHPKPFVRIGADTAAHYGVSDKEEIVVRSRVGHLRVAAHVDERVGAGMVVMPVGTWIKRGGGANVLTEDILTNFGGMAAYGDTRVTIERVAPAIEEHV